MREIPRLTPEETQEVAEGLVKGHYFIASLAPSDMLPLIFLPLAMGGLDDIDPNSLGNIIEDYGKASERSINGYPMFFSCRLIHKDDWSVVADMATAAQRAIDYVMKREP